MSGPLPATAASPLSESFLDERSVAADEEVVAAFDSVLQAELVRGRLEASDIPARLVDAHTVSMASHFASALGGVKVVVHRDDVAEAREVLATAPLVDDDEERSLGPLHDVERSVTWALRTAALGVVLPVVGHALSFAFVARAVEKRSQLTGAMRTKLAVAVAINGVTLLALIAMVT